MLQVLEGYRCHKIPVEESILWTLEEYAPRVHQVVSGWSETGKGKAKQVVPESPISIVASQTQSSSGSDLCLSQAMFLADVAVEQQNPEAQRTQGKGSDCYSGPTTDQAYDPLSWINGGDNFESQGSWSFA
jgi:hypothetical protein